MSKLSTIPDFTNYQFPIGLSHQSLDQHIVNNEGYSALLAYVYSYSFQKNKHKTVTYKVLNCFFGYSPQYTSALVTRLANKQVEPVSEVFRWKYPLPGDGDFSYVCCNEKDTEDVNVSDWVLMTNMHPTKSYDGRYILRMTSSSLIKKLPSRHPAIIDRICFLAKNLPKDVVVSFVERSKRLYPFDEEVEECITRLNTMIDNKNIRSAKTIQHWECNHKINQKIEMESTTGDADQKRIDLNSKTKESDSKNDGPQVDSNILLEEEPSPWFSAFQTQAEPRTIMTPFMDVVYASQPIITISNFLAFNKNDIRRLHVIKLKGIFVCFYPQNVESVITYQCGCLFQKKSKYDVVCNVCRQRVSLHMALQINVKDVETSQTMIVEVTHETLSSFTWYSHDPLSMVVKMYQSFAVPTPLILYTRVFLDEITGLVHLYI
ncbi:hypothetical protein EIN_034440 [Entamoeba invadens IP1]|uniref:Uncharacterized protein n=1 Tax=Entamoeba invadens IP1 TaxID=370355 RepID=A0A0A1U1N2_ENTIV|nr:hypothetical protein EIN_034440 [Entamoeba invadens IP1]ELP86513.1 hypothetical protein EIN_034440 [Entamoeba invadens IP1]|eukprot:XP_004185859.1 hypothetical protein EIN_034440 [Entamoeba invadens IP1]